MKVVPAVTPTLATPIPYVLISGSYKESKENDTLCELLGSYLSTWDIGLMSGAGKPGKNVAFSFFTRLNSEKKYDPDQIVFYYRRKGKDFKRTVDEIGAVKFFGDTPLEMRQKMISKVNAVIIIGGKDGTREEEQLANRLKIPVIPIARTGGVAELVWKKYKRNSYQQFKGAPRFGVTHFELLNNEDIFTTVNATMVLLKNFLLLKAN